MMGLDIAVRVGGGSRDMEIPTSVGAAATLEVPELMPNNSEFAKANRGIVTATANLSGWAPDVQCVPDYDIGGRSAEPGYACGQFSSENPVKGENHAVWTTGVFWGKRISIFGKDLPRRELIGFDDSDNPEYQLETRGRDFDYSDNQSDETRYEEGAGGYAVFDVQLGAMYISNGKNHLTRNYVRAEGSEDAISGDAEYQITNETWEEIDNSRFGVAARVSPKFPLGNGARKGDADNKQAYVGFDFISAYLTEGNTDDHLYTSAAATFGIDY
jgi:hypothetical protein